MKGATKLTPGKLWTLGCVCSPGFWRGKTATRYTASNKMALVEVETWETVFGRKGGRAMLRKVGKWPARGAAASNEASTKRTREGGDVFIEKRTRTVASTRGASPHAPPRVCNAVACSSSHSGNILMCGCCCDVPRAHGPHGTISATKPTRAKLKGASWHRRIPMTSLYSVMKCLKLMYAAAFAFSDASSGLPRSCAAWIAAHATRQSHVERKADPRPRKGSDAP